MCELLQLAYLNDIYVCKRVNTYKRNWNDRRDKHVQSLLTETNFITCLRITLFISM